MTNTAKLSNPPEHLKRAAAVAKARLLAQELGSCGITGDLATVIRAAALIEYLGEWDRAFITNISPHLQAGLKISEKQRHELRRLARDLDALEDRA
jgi:hypothetical protein